MTLFQNEYSTQIVRFGAGIRHQATDEMAKQGLFRALVLSTPRQSKQAKELQMSLGEKAVGLYSKAVMHTPVAITEHAHAYLTSVRADCLIAVGGGSTIGLGKALALRSGLKQLVMPTTYAGSEATPILGQTKDGVKTTIKDNKILPDIVLYDPELIATLPLSMSVTSALNAIAHAVEGLYAKEKEEKTTKLANLGLKAFADALPAVLKKGDDLEAREETLKGAWACGTVLATAGMALHHKLCHALGGGFNLPHAETHAVILPHATAYNEASASQSLSSVTQFFGGNSPAQSLWTFAKSAGAPTSLKQLGMRQEDLAKAADLAIKNPYWNPREITRDGILELLNRAWEGVAPLPA